ncbi:hypothetical protein BGX23_007631 [Mortierella sp. AD031]|nr:hypothetical protein BGX23_007631 [Mortierella sp. AD031]
MSTEHEPILSPKGCPIENFPEDPAHLFSSNGITLDYPRIGWIAAGCCTALATIISFVLIYRHYQYYTKPNQQRYIVRMLLMVPIYAITSWFSFVYVREAIYYETIRVFYEAFVIASFLILLLQYLGDSLEDQKRALKRHKKTERWFFPMCCLKYNPSRPHFLQYMKWGILQYVPLNIIGSLLTVILETQGTYCESSWNPKFGHVWILFINFTSVTLATYFLIMFYFTIRVDLKAYDPFYKFLAIKLVIFFSFWQALVVEGFVYFGYIKASKYWSTGDISVGINALLIDFEMVIFAIIHLKAFSYKPYVPMIPNPDLPQQQQPFLTADGDRDNNSKNDDDPSLASLSTDQLPTAAGGRTQQQQQQQAGGPKRKPAPTTTPFDSTSREKQSSGGSKKGDKKKEKKDEGPPKKIMDFTQKTPIWKGILDSFNPLDTIRELSYGCKYMYRWIRGVPVDKDSRRLLDLEVAFGRQRPEVPYVPTKEELEREKKKKEDKKRKKKGQESEENGSSSNDEDDDSDDNSEKDLEKGSDKGDDNDDDDDDGEENEKGRRHDANGSEGTGAGQAPVSRYRQFQVNNHQGDRGGASNRRMDAAYDMGEGTGTMANGRSTVARKPVKSVAANPILPHLERDPSIKMEKADAARTERATLPDIQPDLVERKIALSGLYVDLPLSPIDSNIGSPNSSVDIPIPMQYRHDRHHQYQSPYEAQEIRGGGGSGGVGGRDWDYGRSQRPRDHRLELDQEQPIRFDHRDRELERAAAASYILPTPVLPKSPEPRFPTAGGAPTSRGGRVGGGPVDVDAPSRGGLTRLANENFVTKGNSYQQQGREFVDDRNRNNSGGKGITRDPPPPSTADPRIVALSYYGQQLGHGRSDSVDNSVVSISTNTDSIVPANGAQFYHHREASRSDPELSHYGHDHEHYLERMRYLEEQNRQAEYYLQLQQQQLQREERRRSQFPLSYPEPSSSTFSSAPVPVPVPVPDSVDAGAVSAAAVVAPDTDSTFIPVQDEEMRNKMGGQQQTLPPPAHTTAGTPVVDNSQVPDPGKVIEDAGPQQQVIQVVQEEDPIVAEYNLLQRHQKLQEQQRTQQELQYQEQQQRYQQQQQQQEQKQQRDQQGAMMMMPPPPPAPTRQQQQQQQHRHLLPRRRNSIESLDSDSSGGGFRVHDYGFRPTGGIGVGVGVGGSRVPKDGSSRYQRAYRYPMPLPQPVPPAQFYQFPQDRDLYDRQRRDRERERERDRGRDRDRDPRYYYQQQQQQQQQQYSSRPYNDDYLRQTYVPQPQQQYGRSSDTRYRSPPPPALPLIDDRPTSRPVRRGTAPLQGSITRDRRDRDPRYTADRYLADTRDPYYPPESPPETLFPASRYAAPFVRDYELQQREREARQRMARSPPIDPSSPTTAQRWQTTAPAPGPVAGSIDRPIPQPGRRGGGADVDGRSRIPPRQMPAAPSAAYSDDGAYEEAAIVWTRPPPVAVPAPTLRD